MAEVNKGTGDKSIPAEVKPQVPGMPGQPNVNKGTGKESSPAQHNWRNAVNPPGGSVGKAPRD